MNSNRPRDDCYGEQEREGDENPCMSEPRMVMDFMRTHTFAMAGAGNLVRSRRLSGSFIIRTPTGNRWIGARNLITGGASVDFLSQLFGVLDHDTVPCMANAPNTDGFQLSEPAGRPASRLCVAAKQPPLDMSLSPRWEELVGKYWRSSRTQMGERIMLKWNEGAYYAANEEVRLIKNRQQNDDFCRALRSALYARTESCAEGVSTEPGTKKPILNYQRPD